MANLAIKINTISVNGVGDLVVQYSADAGPNGSVTTSTHVTFGSSPTVINNAVIADAKVKMAQINPGFTFSGGDVAQLFGGAV